MSATSSPPPERSVAVAELLGQIAFDRDGLIAAVAQQLDGAIENSTTVADVAAKREQRLRHDGFSQESRRHR